MKRLYVSIGIIITLISTGIASLWHLQTSTEKAIEIVEKALETAENGDLEKAEQLNEELQVFWSEKKSLIMLYVRHDDITQIGSLISELNPLLKYSSIPEYMAKLYNIKYMFDKMAKEEIPLPVNIL